VLDMMMTGQGHQVHSEHLLLRWFTGLRVGAPGFQCVHCLNDFQD